MSGTIQLTDGLEPFPSQSQAQPHYPNFSRPRPRHRRSYSTGLPFQYSKDSSDKSLQNGDTPTSPMEWAQDVSVDTPAIKRPRISQARDDGMIADPKQRRLAEERRWAEEDVRDAFKRWDVSDKARQKLRQPPTVTAPRDAKSIPEPYVQNGRDRRKVKDKGPIFEKVEGVQLDTRPGGATGPYGMEETLPEIEAHDIRDIQARSAVNPTLQSDVEEDQGTLSSLTNGSRSDSSGVSPQLWSESSGSSSTASTENSTMKPYQHVSEEFMSSNEYDHGNLEQIVGSDQGPVRPISAADVSELDSRQGPSSPHKPAGPLKAHRLPLEVIDEESRSSVVGNEDIDAAPAPNVKGIKDEEVLGYSPHFLLATSDHAKATTLTKNTTSPVHDTSAPRMLVAAGIGEDKHVYELEAAVPPDIKTSRSDTSADAAVADQNHGHGILDKVEHGVSKAVHALHEKVKKTVTFSPVNDVRFMTPSPYPSSIDKTTAADVDTQP
ncbi:hypothetical protein H2200_003429 [Cladophialophora chaetospira]|uniref:Uncharacterized protein n=1 Tax=Cladophialophora chaetospira TaxID=386627 RepID=A0AA38XHF3_9EURO|nr:hypothetical protein H2200_003429 [Cladophialophora chaetospira]